MDLILCHLMADFDALGGAVGLSKLHPNAKIVLTAGAHPSVKNFLALHRNEFALIEKRSINPSDIRNLIIVDTQNGDRLDQVSEWLYLETIESITIYDHHPEGNGNIPFTHKFIEPVGAVTTLITEKIQQANISLNSMEATVMALGIYVDTGCLTFEQTTPRDAYAVAFLLSLGANINTIGTYSNPSLSPQLQQLLRQALKDIQQEEVSGNIITSVLLTTKNFVPGLSNLTEKLRDLTEADIFLLANFFEHNNSKNEKKYKLTIIGRSKLNNINLVNIFQNYGGGGHHNAASFTMHYDQNPKHILNSIINEIKKQIPTPLTAKNLMSSPVRTIRPQSSIEEAQKILLRYNHSGLFIVNENDQLIGVISRRDIDLALHHGFKNAPVKGYMTKNLITINLETTLKEIEFLIVKNDIGRLPVLENDQLLGIVTRTDILRQIHQNNLLINNSNSLNKSTLINNKKLDLASLENLLISCLLPSLKNKLDSNIWQILEKAANYAQIKGYHLYLVGGGVRDLFLSDNNTPLKLQDIDLVVDGFQETTVIGAGVELAKMLIDDYPEARISIHGEFQTASLIWHKDKNMGNLMIDIATARTEFYPYPAANPEVESSSIKQDLYRRDFTINALAIRLTNPNSGELLDFFNGLADLQSQQVKVLHPNSFIEDPTRIYRAVRFAVRLNFNIETQTEEYIRYAVSSGIYEEVSRQKNSIPALRSRLKAELTYILQSSYWQRALHLLSNLGALNCLYPNLVINKKIWWQIRYLNRWLKFYDTNRNLSHWLIRLEVILVSIPDLQGVKVAQNLELPKESINRVQQIRTFDNKNIQKLTEIQTISEIVEILNSYNKVTLILIALNSDKLVRRKIWTYLMNWSKIILPINGEDLKRLGYKPGKEYKEILKELQKMFLDGKITNREEAEKFILQKYPF